MVQSYDSVRELVSAGRHAEAVDAYYLLLRERPYGELHKELLYLKRVAGIPLIGRDLLFFRPQSTFTALIKANMLEYCASIDSVLQQQALAGLPSLLTVLEENSFDLAQLLDRGRTEAQIRYVYLTTSSHATMFQEPGPRPTDDTCIHWGCWDRLTTKYYKCFTGTLFPLVPDLVQHCRMIEAPLETRFFKLWTVHSPAYYEAKVVAEGRVLYGIEVYRHKRWRGAKREPDFATLNSLADVVHEDCAAPEIKYAGRCHTIDHQTFFELDIIRRNPDKQKDLGNPFLDLVDEILRDAEDELRVDHGLPRIGEGWVSEMTLYSLVREFWADAQHHVSPPWLKPQHLDIYVPTEKVAFEYQGKQHFEPVEFFGGETSFEKTKERDAIKLRKCRANGVRLMYWRYDEPIEAAVLLRKLNRPRK